MIGALQSLAPIVRNILAKFAPPPPAWRLRHDRPGRGLNIGVRGRGTPTYKSGTRAKMGVETASRGAIDGVRRGDSTVHPATFSGG